MLEAEVLREHLHSVSSTVAADSFMPISLSKMPTAVVGRHITCPRVDVFLVSAPNRSSECDNRTVRKKNDHTRYRSNDDTALNVSRFWQTDDGEEDVTWQRQVTFNNGDYIVRLSNKRSCQSWPRSIRQTNAGICVCCVKSLGPNLLRDLLQ